MLSKKVKYGLKAAFYLAKHYDNGLTIISAIADEEYIPLKFLEKILLELKKGGVLVSKIGRDGGYRLAKPPKKIYIGQIMRILEGPLAPVPCVSRTGYERCYDCEDEATCEIKRAMELVRQSMSSVLDKTTLAGTTQT